MPTISPPTCCHQGSFDELGTPLRETVFVVVDLETTGGSPATCQITEVGAVKVRAGEVLGTFETLVNPGQAIPPFIAVLTGISDHLVAGAPRLAEVVPAFLEFARGAVLVAHNAPFDLGFLRAACERTGHAWPGFGSVDTAQLARRVLTRDEAPDCRLSTLARVLRTEATPCHRAMADARTTVEVLHVLLARVGSLGVQSLEELRTFSGRVSAAQRRKRHLAEPLPHSPGVYLFRDGQGRILYVGTSRDLRSRVRGYFAASEQRSRMAEMVGLAERVDHLVCAHPLEAAVRELRLIAAHKPRYNRRSRHPERAVWVKLTVEAFPRLSVVRQVRGDGAPYLGPFGSSRSAEAAVAALHEVLPLRRCTGRLSPLRPRPACALAELGRCGAPCESREDTAAYAAHVTAAAGVFGGDIRPTVRRLEGRLTRLAGQQRFEDAASLRDRVGVLVRAAHRRQRLGALAGCALLVAAQATGRGGWDVIVIRHGRLCAAGSVPAGTAPRPVIDALVATGEVVGPPGPGPTPHATAEEMELILTWLATPGSRLVELDGTWCSPAWGAGSATAWLEIDIHAATPLADRRRLRPQHQPTGAGGGV